MIIDEEKEDHVEICFGLGDGACHRQQRNDHDITSGVLSLDSNNWKKRTFETEDGTVRAIYNGKTRFLFVVFSMKNKNYKGRSTLKAGKRLRSAIQLLSKKAQCLSSDSTL